MNNKKIIRPVKGIDTDSSLNRRDDNCIYMAKNLRLNNSEDNSLGYYANFNGVQYVCRTNPASSFLAVVLKLEKISDNIIIFLKYASDSYPDRICLVKESQIPTNGTTIALYMSDYYWNSTTRYLVIKGDFGFSTTNDISTKTYYESELVQKVYWVTGKEPLRCLNVIYSDINDPSSYSENDLCLVPDADLSIPTIKKTISGSLKCGKIYYAYKLVTPNGAETNLSEFSKPYHITKSSELDYTDYKYRGYGIDVDSGKGCLVNITSIPSSFNRIKLYSIHYINDTSVPTVSLVYDNIASSTMNINDTGSSESSISAEEFVSINSIYNNGGVIEIKNNIMFLSNYSEVYFNIDDYTDDGYWDSRAYRFYPSTTTTRLYNNDLTTYTDYNLVNMASIPHDADCINLHNNCVNYTANAMRYAYKAGGTIVGATGLNIVIGEISSVALFPDYQTTSAGKKWCSKQVSSFSGYASYSNPNVDANYKTFKLEETYRISIQFKNHFGQLSYPKWICDYRFFDYTFGSLDSSSYCGNASTATSQIKTFVKGLNFTVSNIPDDPITGEPFEWRILHVPISESDESVHWGLVAPITNGYINNNSSYSGYAADPLMNSYASGRIFNTQYCQFISPDYCFGKSSRYSKFQVVAYNDVSTDSIYDFKYEEDNYPAKSVCYIYKIYKLTDYNQTMTISSQYDIKYEDYTNSGVDMNEDRLTYDSLSGTHKFYNINRIIYNNANDSLSEDFIMYQTGRCQILTPTIAITGTSKERVFIGCAYIDNFQSKHGGLSYESRMANGYTPLSQFTSSSSQNVYGDCYIGLFEHLRTIGFQGEWETAVQQKTVAEVLIFPTITKYNLNLRTDLYFTREYTKSGSIMMKEYAGVYQSSLLINDPITYTQTTDLYLYNNTYSRDQDLFLYYVKQDLDSVEVEFNTRIIASDNKILGESSDSFLKFSTSNYIDVDGRYGNIVTLENFNNRLYYFQENAIGIVATNERASTSTSEGSEVVMGTTGLLSRFDYLTLYNGITSPNHVKKSATSLYCIDAKKKLILLINENGAPTKLSITKNVDSFVKSKYWDDSIVIYNQNYQEVLFVYKETSSSSTTSALVFNEYIGQFTGIYTYSGKITLSERINGDISDELVFSNTDNFDYLGLLNSGNYNSMAGAYYASEITYLITSNEESNLLFNVVELILKQVDSSGATNDFIDTIRFYNDIDDSGELDFQELTSFKFGKYRTNKIRNSSSKRILNNHLYVQIKTRNNNSAENSRVFFRDLMVVFNEYKYFG